MVTCDRCLVTPESRALMPNRKLNPLTIALAATLATAAPVFSASEESPIASALNDFGQQFYERGDFAQAAQEFSKALLVDPENAVAREYLGKMGFPGGLYPVRGTPADRALRQTRQAEELRNAVAQAEERRSNAENVAEDLARERNVLEDRLGRKTSEADSLWELLKGREFEAKNYQIRLTQTQKEFADSRAKQESDLALLRDEVGAIKDTSTRQELSYREGTQVLQGQVEGLQKDLRESQERIVLKDLDLARQGQELACAKEELASLNREMQQRDRTVAQDAERLAAMNVEVKRLQDELGLPKKARSSKKVSRAKAKALAPEVAALQERFAQEKQSLEERTGELTTANDKIGELQKQLESMTADLAAAQQEVSRLKAAPSAGAAPDASAFELESARKKLLEQEVIIENQNDQVALLSDRIIDLEERLSLTQRIVQEKEANLQELSGKVEELQKKCAK